NAFACTVEGMCCAAESIPIERAVRALPGVRQVVADTGLARLSVTYDTAALTPERIVAQVERLGFRIAPTSAADSTQPDEHATHDHTHHISRGALRPRDLLTA